MDVDQGMVMGFSYFCGFDIVLIHRVYMSSGICTYLRCATNPLASLLGREMLGSLGPSELLTFWTPIRMGYTVCNFGGLRLK